MHQVLLIDEILEVLLDHCAEWPAEEYRFTLCQVARSCRAWQDPATDRLWKKLQSVQPLLRMLRAACNESRTLSTTGPAPHLHYFEKVKQVTFGKDSDKLPALPEMPLPNLVSAKLDASGCLVAPQWLQSSQLQELDVILRCNSDGRDTQTRCVNVSRILLHASANSVTGIQKLRVKGWMSPILTSALQSVSALRHLTLHTGKSLDAQTLSSLATLPHLECLYAHASEIEAHKVASFLPPHTVTFPKLLTLRVRASRDLIELLLQLLHPETLRSLHIESEDSRLDSKAWRETFSLLATQVSTSLSSLTIDQILDVDEIEQDTPSSVLGNDIDTHFTIDALEPLSALRALQHFTLDTMIPPNFTDDEVDRLTTWWPRLRELDLGTLPSSMEHAPAWTPKPTLMALECVAKRCPRLHALTIPLAIPFTSSPAPAGPKSTARGDMHMALQKLHVGDPRIASPKDIHAFVRRALKIFPNLIEVDYSGAEKSASVDLAEALQAGGKVAVDRTAGTEDGFADGQ